MAQGGQCWSAAESDPGQEGWGATGKGPRLVGLPPLPPSLPWTTFPGFQLVLPQPAPTCPQELEGTSFEVPLPPTPSSPVGGPCLERGGEEPLLTHSNRLRLPVGWKSPAGRVLLVLLVLLLHQKHPPGLSILVQSPSSSPVLAGRGRQEAGSGSGPGWSPVQSPHPLLLLWSHGFRFAPFGSTP